MPKNNNKYKDKNIIEFVIKAEIVFHLGYSIF